MIANRRPPLRLLKFSPRQLRPEYDQIRRITKALEQLRHVAPDMLDAHEVIINSTLRRALGTEGAR
jgi:hypothetical protein